MRANKRLVLLAGVVMVALGILACGTDYDHDVPDTPANREGFERHFGFAVPDAVSDLYYFIDSTGSDVLIQLGFETDQGTVDRIASELALEQGDLGFGVEYLTHDFPWWDGQVIENLTPYWTTNEDEDYFWILWHDPATRRAYYLEFSL